MESAGYFYNEHTHIHQNNHHGLQYQNPPWRQSVNYKIKKKIKLLKNEVLFTIGINNYIEYTLPVC